MDEQRYAPLLSGRLANNPKRGEPGKRIVGFVVDADVAGLSEGLFMLDALVAAARPAPARPSREEVARVIGSYVIYDDNGGPYTEVLQDVIGVDYDDATRRVYELTDAILSLFPEQTGEGGSSRELAPTTCRGDGQEPATESAWRPIDTAPRDGAEILLLSDEVAHHGCWQGPSDGAIYSGSPCQFNWFSRTCGQSLHDGGVTHWAPLPAPPVAAKPSPPSSDGKGSRDEPIPPPKSAIGDAEPSAS